MKNRFYGDVNDYIKYGILDILSQKYKSIGINWYLTDDNRGKQGDGKRIDYFDNEREWKCYNPRVFDLLKKRVNAKQRNIAYCKQDRVIDFKYEFYDQLPDNAIYDEYKLLRGAWHARAKKQLEKCDLVFFDPDIGVVDELSKSVVKSSEYCLTKEIEDYNTCDWLIVIFPQRSKRYPALKNNPIVKSAELHNKIVMVFMYGGMVLLYISSKVQVEIFRHVFEQWDTRVSTNILVS